MTAAIYLDPLMFQPVIDGNWHRPRLARIPRPGEAITMLCGASAAVEYRPASGRRQGQAHRQCALCDEIFRQEQGIPSWKDRVGR
jgi:hypothetical protein